MSNDVCKRYLFTAAIISIIIQGLLLVIFVSKYDFNKGNNIVYYGLSDKEYVVFAKSYNDAVLKRHKTINVNHLKKNCVVDIIPLDVLSPNEFKPLPYWCKSMKYIFIRNYKKKGTNK